MLHNIRFYNLMKRRNELRAGSDSSIKQAQGYRIVCSTAGGIFKEFLKNLQYIAICQKRLEHLKPLMQFGTIKSDANKRKSTICHRSHYRESEE